MIKPGIFEKNFAHALKKIRLVELISPVIHIDIADGKLVDGTTFLELDKVADLETAASLELHLMVQNPTDFVLPSLGNVTTIISQIEAENIAQFIQTCRDFGYNVGLSLKPESEIESVIQFIDQVDLIQVMTVHPGGQGRPFVEKSIEKLTQLRELYPTTILQADGAMDKEHIEQIETDINIEHYVIGSDIFGAENPLLEEQLAEDLID